MPGSTRKPSSRVSTGGQLHSSITDIPMATPKQPSRHGGALVGGPWVDFGIKRGSKAGGRPKRMKRSKMY